MSALLAAVVAMVTWRHPDLTCPYLKRAYLLLAKLSDALDDDQKRKARTLDVLVIVMAAVKDANIVRGIVSSWHNVSPNLAGAT